MRLGEEDHGIGIEIPHANLVSPATRLVTEVETEKALATPETQISATPQPGASHSKSVEVENVTVAVDQGVLEPKPAWKDLFAQNREPANGWKLKYVPSDDSEIVEYTYAEIRTEVNRWQYTLVGVPMGVRVSFSTMDRYIENHWQMVSKPELRLTNSGVFLYSFKLEEDL